MKYLKLLQERTGQLAIGRSTLRNQGAPKVIETTRTYLQRMNLSTLKKIDSETKYNNFLERHTKALSKKFPGKAKGNWGAARKAINIFIRDCLYNQYLSEAYDIDRLEAWLEVPLDRDVAENLIKKHPNKLPRWISIRSLDKGASDKFQNQALISAANEGVARVHLDIKYWRNGKYTTNKAYSGQAAECNGYTESNN
jgi:hypothetical protein